MKLYMKIVPINADIANVVRKRLTVDTEECCTHIYMLTDEEGNESWLISTVANYNNYEYLGDWIEKELEPNNPDWCDMIEIHDDVLESTSSNLYTCIIL